MECRRFEFKIISASNLRKVRESHKKKFYAVVSIAENSKTERKTQVDMDNKTNPVWNYTIKYTVGEKAVQQEGVKLAIQLYCERYLGDVYMGEIKTSTKQLYDQANANGGSTVLTYPVHEVLGTSQGELQLSCKFGEKVIFEKPSFWKKLWADGALVFVHVALHSIFGMDLETEDSMLFETMNVYAFRDYECEREIKGKTKN